MQDPQAFASGRVNRVKAIMRVDRDEHLAGTATTADGYRALRETQFGALAPQVLALYPLARFRGPFVASRTVMADADTVCPALVRDERLSRWIPVYAYEGDDTDAPPAPLNFPPTNPNGAAHVVDDELLFPGSYGAPTTFDANQQALSDEILTEVRFRGDGRPERHGDARLAQISRGGQVMSTQPAGDSELVTTGEISAQHNCGFWNRISRGRSESPPVARSRPALSWLAPAPPSPPARVSPRPLRSDRIVGAACE
jgi:para-nitrobenzyl esterase